MSLTSNRGVSGTFTGTGQSSSPDTCTNYAVNIEGGVGTVDVERQAPDGSTWITMESLTVSSDDHAKEYEGIGQPIRLNCSAYTSGTISYWIEGYNKAG
jgi:hypothetical protein